MGDVHEPEVRSYNMSRVKGKNTKPELKVRSALHSRGLRFNLNGRSKGGLLPGKPDLVLPKYRTVIFVHGCFWHAHEDCKYFKFPETRRDFWKKKLMSNRRRDQQNVIDLKEGGWRVLVIWTCELKTSEKENKRLEKLYREVVQPTT
jgi:DNA mismatch endonuclease (patch repair protein)